LKLVLFENLGAVSYSPSIVTVAVSVAVCEICSVKEWVQSPGEISGTLMTLISPGDCTLQRGMWLWNHDSEFTKWQHPAM